MSLVYLTALLVSAGCMLLVDWRYRLFVFHAPVRALSVVMVGTVFFLVWDIAGIALGIFQHGPAGSAAGWAPYMTGIMIGPELPLEEVIFLMFLCHITMVLLLGAHRLIHHREQS